MKMIYPQRDNRRKRKKILVVSSILGAVIFVVILLNVFNPHIFSPMLNTFGRPILEARGGFLGSINNAWQFLHSKGELVSENNAFKQRLVLMKATEVERDYYKYTNAELLKRVGQIQDEKEITFAKIISKPGFSPYDTMIINVGTNDGVYVGDSVLATQDSWLGMVQKSYKHTSLVVLNSSPSFETSVLIGTKSIQAIAIGKGGGNFEIKLPRNTEVKVGDIVVLASSTPNIIGVIEFVHSSPTDTFERALLTSSADVAELLFVTVEKKR